MDFCPKSISFSFLLKSLNVSLLRCGWTRRCGDETKKKSESVEDKKGASWRRRERPSLMGEGQHDLRLGLPR